MYPTANRGKYFFTSLEFALGLFFLQSDCCQTVNHSVLMWWRRFKLQKNEFFQILRLSEIPAKELHTYLCGTYSLLRFEIVEKNGLLVFKGLNKPVMFTSFHWLRYLKYLRVIISTLSLWNRGVPWVSKKEQKREWIITTSSSKRLVDKKVLSVSQFRGCSGSVHQAGTQESW